MSDAALTAPDEHSRALTRLMTSLADISPSAPLPVLRAAWDGLGLARACGLAAATAVPAEWDSRQRNAETVEYLLARELTRTDAANSLTLVLQPATRLSETRGTVWAATMIQSILDFTRTAETVAGATADAATEWDDQRSFRACASLFDELGACWRGERPSYQLRITGTSASPWWEVHPSRGSEQPRRRR
ncbi:hypothetical protein CFP71_28340 [Amycolatopsis thailandensis]|uniref:Uncharacterized protein n=1 Tax=Amycolatopsis thailandensis TaxID=589330 RepID=A0A229RUJ4_9PSEU|nr:hypothetical protein CFP71_28340 [Amycolatopsis thailandensis]